VNESPELAGLIKSLSLLDVEFSSKFIDSCESVANLVDNLASLPTDPPLLYLDLEGIYLSCHGSISILQIFVSPQKCMYLIDVHTLQEKAFLTAGTAGKPLKMILESDRIPKVFFDVCNDSDALYAHFGIKLAGVQDIQLMELATRDFSKRYLNGLLKCIERDSPMMPGKKQKWKSVKERGLRLFAPERGGSYEVFNVRPLAKDVAAYCIQDVQYMPRLWSEYRLKLTLNWAAKVEQATKDRITLSQSKSFNGKGSHMALGLW
jgi:exonuclease 3'-5' domain-containing protein 1